MTERKIDTVVAVLMIGAVLAVMVGGVAAYSDGGKYNIIEKIDPPQKVLIGQDLQFEGLGDSVTVSRLVSGDIENVYQADGNNRIYNVNWPTSGVYYVNYDSTTKKGQAQLSVEEVNIPLELKVGTELTIDTAGMNLFPEDVVDLVVRDSDGQIKYDTVNDQQFTGITVAELNTWYGDNNLKTAGWTIGAYTFKVKTDDVHACGLEAESVERALQVIKGEITIGAATTSAVELETVKLVVTGTAEEKIRVEGDKHVVFKSGIDDVPMGATNSFEDTIDADGVRKYAVEFTDTGTFTIKVTVTDGDRAGDSDTVDITVLEKEVEFDLPSLVRIGSMVTIKGTATSGTYVSVFIDDTLYKKLVNIVIEEDGEFSQKVRTSDVGMNIQGPVRLKAWIDCDKAAGEERPTRSPDGEDAILLTTPTLTAELSVPSVALEDDFKVLGTAKGQQEVMILSVPPKGGGGKALLDKGDTGISLMRASVSTTDYTFSKKMTVQEDATTGYYDLYVVSSGMDRYWSMTGKEDINAAFEEKYGIELSGHSIATKSQTEIQDILEDMIYAPGSDDMMVKVRVKVEGGEIEIAKVTTKGPGEPVVVTGTSNMKDGYTILLTCKGLVELTPVTTKVVNGKFRSTFDTRDAETGTYTVTADDGDRTASQEITINATYLALNPIAISAGEELVVRGRSNIGDGSKVVVTCEGPQYDEERNARVKNGTFEATYNIIDAVEGKYTVKVENVWFRLSAETSVKIQNETTPTKEPRKTPTQTPTPTPPGFEAVFTIAGLLAVAYLVHRRKH